MHECGVVVSFQESSTLFWGEHVVALSHLASPAPDSEEPYPPFTTSVTPTIHPDLLPLPHGLGPMEHYFPVLR